MYIEFTSLSAILVLLSSLIDNIILNIVISQLEPSILYVIIYECLMCLILLLNHLLYLLFVLLALEYVLHVDGPLALLLELSVPDQIEIDVF